MDQICTKYIISKHIKKPLRDYLLAVENLALGKPATQSDVLWSYKPGLAVDGDPNTCSFTSREESPRWWQVHTKLMVTRESSLS